MPRFSQNLNYTHERLYRTISGVIVGDESYRERLASAQRMMCVLGPSDFPRELRDAFRDIVDTPALTMSEDARKRGRESFLGEISSLFYQASPLRAG
jgi:hypothetical protein